MKILINKLIENADLFEVNYSQVEVSGNGSGIGYTLAKFTIGEGVTSIEILNQFGVITIEIEIELLAYNKTSIRDLFDQASPNFAVDLKYSDESIYSHFNVLKSYLFRATSISLSSSHSSFTTVTIKGIKLY